MLGECNLTGCNQTGGCFMKNTVLAVMMFFSLMYAFPSLSQIEKKEKDFTFEQERMLIIGNEIYLTSNLKGEDHVSKYNFQGKLLWDAPFFAKILSLDVRKQGVIVFSKKRDGSQTYLTLLKPENGKIVWQRP